MSRKVAVVTGATSGIGRAVALGLVEQGYELVAIARNESKVDALRRDARARRQGAIIEYHYADLSLVSSTQTALAAIVEQHERIDLLLFSAALVPSQRVVTDERIEKCFAISYLSRVVVTEALLPALMRSDDKLLIDIASPGMKAKVDFEDVNFERRTYGTMAVLGQFQHANDVYFTDLHETHKAAGLRAYVYHPGVVDTPIHDNWPTMIGFFMRYLMWPMKITPERSAKFPLELASGTFGCTTHMFNHKGQSLTTPEEARDGEYRRRVVALSREMIASATRARAA